MTKEEPDLTTFDGRIDAFIDGLPNAFDGMLYIVLYDKVDIAQSLHEKIKNVYGEDYSRRITFTNQMPKEEIRNLKSTNLYIFSEFYNYQGNGYN